MNRIWTGRTGIRGVLASLAIVCGVTVTIWSTAPQAAPASPPHMMGGEWILGVGRGEAVRVTAVSNPLSRGSARLRFVIIDERGSELYRSDGLLG